MLSARILLAFAVFNTCKLIIVVGGNLGVITALAAWYASAAGVINGHQGCGVFPVGKPLLTLWERACRYR